MICGLFGALFLSGCETTDYEPLIMKTKLRELEEQIETIGKPGSAEIPADLAERIGQLENEVSNLKKSNRELKDELVAQAKKNEQELFAELESRDAFVEKNSDGLIETIDLTEIRYDNAFLRKLSDLRELKNLSLTGSTADIQTFEIVGKMANLERLDIERAPATPEALEHLQQLPKLKFIYLFRATMSDESMKVISDFPALEQIRCGQTRVSDKGLAYLEKLKSLRAIDLSDCNRVSNSGLAALANLPNLNFVKVWGP